MKVKFRKSYAPGNIKNSYYFSTLDYQSLARKVFLDSKKSTGPQIDDLWTTLEITRNSQLTFQAYGKGFGKYLFSNLEDNFEWTTLISSLIVNQLFTVQVKSYSKPL